MVILEQEAIQVEMAEAVLEVEVCLPITVHLIPEVEVAL